MIKALKVWWRYTSNAFQLSLMRKKSAVIFLFSKLLRIGLFVFFLSSFLRGAQGVGGYTQDQIIFCYLTFNVIDSASQLLFREVYRFRQLIVTGNLDYVLVKPINPLLRVLVGGADIYDLIMLLILGGATVTFAASNLAPDWWLWLAYLVMILNSLIIAAAFHIFVLGQGVLTTTVDHLILVYRDTSNLMRIPVDLYVEPLRALLIFVIPLGIMMTFPAKILLGLLSPFYFFLSFGLALLTLYLAIRFWKFTLNRYQSASS